MPTPLRLTPTPKSGNVRHARPWGEHSRTRYVPLWTPLAKGQIFEGKIEVPLRLCWAEPNTNAKHEFDRLIREQLERWVQWRGQRGWEIVSFPKVRGPYEVPTATANDESNPEIRWYFVQARFRRSAPAYVRLEDILAERDKAATFGIDPDQDRPPWNDLAGERGETDWGNGLQMAEAWRQRYGLKRKDYLFGPLIEPAGTLGKTIDIQGGRVRAATRVKSS